MAASRADLPLPPGWGVAWLEGPPLAPAVPGAVRSYTHDGWRLSWAPMAGSRAGSGPGQPSGFGCDVERCDVRPPGPVIRRLGLASVDNGMAFWKAWTRLEAEAKAAGVPILAWIRSVQEAEAGRPAGGARAFGFEAVHVLRPGGLDVVAAFVRRTAGG